MLQILSLAVQVANEEWGPCAPREQRELLPYTKQFFMYVWPMAGRERKISRWSAVRVCHTVGVPA